MKLAPPACAIWLVTGGVTCLVISACTPYQQMGFTGGVDDLQVSDTSYRITARGNGYTTSERVHDFILLRASEIAIGRGYERFVISDMSDQSRVATSVSPGSVHTVSFQNPLPVAGMVMPAHVFTNVTPPSISTVLKPGFIAFVTLVRDGGMDARMIYASLAPRYGVVPAAAATPAAQAAPPAPAAPPVERRSLGVRAVAVTDWRAYSSQLDPPRGVVVMSVMQGGAAAGAGLRAGDVILSLGASPLMTVADLQQALAATAPNSVVTAQIWRDRQELAADLHF